MKKLTTVSLFIFWAVVVAILTAGILSFQNNKNSNNLTNTIGNIQNNSNPSSNTNTSNGAGSIVLSMAEVSKHSSSGDCFMVINNKVYNVTKAISAHPGGATEIIKFCGQDATVAFNTKDNTGRPHSGGANADLSSYFVGNLNQTIGTQQVQQSIQKTNTVVPSRRGRENDD